MLDPCGACRWAAADRRDGSAVWDWLYVEDFSRIIAALQHWQTVPRGTLRATSIGPISRWQRRLPRGRS